MTQERIKHMADGVSTEGRTPQQGVVTKQEIPLAIKYGIAPKPLTPEQSANILTVVQKGRRERENQERQRQGEERQQSFEVQRAIQENRKTREADKAREANMSPLEIEKANLLRRIEAIDQIQKSGLSNKELSEEEFQKRLLRVGYKDDEEGALAASLQRIEETKDIDWLSEAQEKYIEDAKKESEEARQRKVAGQDLVSVLNKRGTGTAQGKSEQPEPIVPKPPAELTPEQAKETAAYLRRLRIIIEGVKDTVSKLPLPTVPKTSPPAEAGTSSAAELETAPKASEIPKRSMWADMTDEELGKVLDTDLIGIPDDVRQRLSAESLGGTQGKGMREYNEALLTSAIEWKESQKAVSVPTAPKTPEAPKPEPGDRFEGKRLSEMKEMLDADIRAEGKMTIEDIKVAREVLFEQMKELPEDVRNKIIQEANAVSEQQAKAFRWTAPGDHSKKFISDLQLSQWGFDNLKRALDDYKKKNVPVNSATPVASSTAPTEASKVTAIQETARVDVPDREIIDRLKKLTEEQDKEFRSRVAVAKAEAEKDGQKLSEEELDELEIKAARDLFKEVDSQKQPPVENVSAAETDEQKLIELYDQTLDQIAPRRTGERDDADDEVLRILNERYPKKEGVEDDEVSLGRAKIDILEQLIQEREREDDGALGFLRRGLRSARSRRRTWI